MRTSAQENFRLTEFASHFSRSNSHSELNFLKWIGLNTRATGRGWKVLNRCCKTLVRGKCSGVRYAKGITKISLCCGILSSLIWQDTIERAVGHYTVSRDYDVTDQGSISQTIFRALDKMAAGSGLETIACGAPLPARPRDSTACTSCTVPRLLICIVLYCNIIFALYSVTVILVLGFGIDSTIDYLNYANA